MVQCEVIYFMVMHNILEYTGLLARGMAADGWLCCATARGGVFQPWNTPSLASYLLELRVDAAQVAMVV